MNIILILALENGLGGLDSLDGRGRQGDVGDPIVDVNLLAVRGKIASCLCYNLLFVLV